MPVIRSTLRILLPSQSIPTAAAFFSTFNLFIFLTLNYLEYCNTLFKMIRQQEKKSRWGGARPNTGPKTKTVAYRRRRTAIVRLTDGEKRAVRQVARQAGTTFSEWMRQVLLAHVPAA